MQSDVVAANRTPTSTEGYTSTLSSMLAEAVGRLAERGMCQRMLFVTGAGDVQGSHAHWVAGRDDPSIPALAYSAQVYELATALGAQLTVLSDVALSGPRIDGTTRFQHCTMAPARGIRYHLAELGYVLRVIGHALAIKADTILWQRHMTHFWPMALARLFGIRLLVSLHNTFWPIHRTPTQREKLIGRLNGWFFRRTSGVVCVSGAIRRQVEAMAGSGRVLTDVHCPQYKASLAHAFCARSDARPLERVLYLGRIEDEKGVFQLLDAFAMTAAAYPRLGLRFIGTGGALERLRGAARALPAEIAERIEIPGSCDGAGVFTELRRADLLVCPTTGRFAEGLAKTPIEAAMVGVPSIVTSVVPVAEMLGDAALTVETDNVSALASALDRLVRDPARLASMSQAAGVCRDRFFDKTQSLASRLLLCLEASETRERVSQAKDSASNPAFG